MTDFFKVPLPVFPPSCCRLCTASSDPAGFVDLGQDLQAAHPDARIYVCARCSGQLGAAFGMVSGPDAEALRVSLAEAEGEVTVLGLKLEAAEDRIAVSGDELAMLIWDAVNNRPEMDESDPTACPDCGQPKGAQSKRCRSCSARIASEARKTGTAA